MADLLKQPNQPSEKDLDCFLSTVNEIETVIKGLNSEDDQEREKFMSKADKLIEKVDKKKEEKDNPQKEEKDLPQTREGFSRTSINKDAYKNEAPPPPNVGPAQNQPFDQEGFMAAMEADAKERAERRREREKIASVFKEKGNAEFKQGNYKEALDFYDKAIEQVKDSTALYTNRAQARIKMEMYAKALADCDLALRLWPSCMKAYVHQGHAYLGLRDFHKARESYSQILTIDSSKEAMVQGYLAEVQRLEETLEAETRASQLFEDGDEAAKGIVDLLTRVNKQDQLPLFYAGGFRLITTMLDNTDSQTLFRTNDGLRLPQTHAQLNRCLSADAVSLSKDERDLVTAALNMLTAACKDNDTSKQQLLALPDLPSQLVDILEAKFKGQGRLMRTGCLVLLHEISMSPAGRSALVTQMDISRLVPALFPLMARSSSPAPTAANLFNNITLDTRVKALLREVIDIAILPALDNLLKCNKTAASIISITATTVANLAMDITIRNKMCARTSLWDIISQLLINFTNANLSDPLESLLALLVNLSIGVEPIHLRNLTSDIAASCYSVLTSEDLSEPARTRALVVISNLALHCPKAELFLTEDDRPLTILEFMKCEDPARRSSALRTMTAITKTNIQARELLANNKGTSVLLNLLNSEDETILGNAALCLSHLSSLKKVCTKLTKTNVIQRLLVLVRDGRKPEVQSNCAILIGKLTQGDPRHLERLRELHGIEILHDCMKFIK